MRRSHHLFRGLAVALLLLLAACANTDSVFPPATITAVTPAVVSSESGIITISGANFYERENGGGVRIELCGITIPASIIEPVARLILLPPAARIPVGVGSQLTATLPAAGLEPGMSSIRVIRPDGSSVILENAVTCLEADPEPEPEPEPDPEEPEVERESPVVTEFRVTNGPAVAGRPTVFAYQAENPEDSQLVCTFYPGDGSPDLEILDCDAGEITHTYDNPGDYFPVLGAWNGYWGASRGSSLTVSAPGNQPPTAAFTHVFDAADPRKIYLDASSSEDPDGSISSYEWTFSNGDTSTGMTTEYSYMSADLGAHSVSLSVTDNEGAISTITEQITVSVPVRVSVEHLGISPLSTLTGPDNYDETIIGDGTFYVSQAGTYTLKHGPVDENIIVGQAGNYNRTWSPLDPPWTIGVTNQTISFTTNPLYKLKPAKLNIILHGLPDGINSITHPQLGLELERLEESDAITWIPVGLNTLAELQPGIYRLKTRDLYWSAYTNGKHFHEAYLAPESLPELIILSSGDDLELPLTYELQTGSLTVESRGLPNHLTQSFTVERVLPGTAQFEPVTGSLDSLRPGVYEVRPNQVPDVRTVEVAEDDHVDVDIHYQASPIQVSLGSNASILADPLYSLPSGRLRIVIDSSPAGNLVVGNITFRQLPDGAPVTVTAYTGQTTWHEFYVPAGVYEILIGDTPAVPGVHGGYSLSSYPNYPDNRVVVNSYGLGGNANHETVYVEYTAN